MRCTILIIFARFCQISNDVSEGRFGSYRDLSRSAYSILSGADLGSASSCSSRDISELILFETSTLEPNSSTADPSHVSEHELAKSATMDPEERFTGRLDSCKIKFCFFCRIIAFSKFRGRFCAKTAEKY